MKTRRPSRLPRPTAPDSAQREYFRFLNKYVSAYIKLVRQGLAEIIPDLKEEAEVLPKLDSTRMDANIEERIGALLDQVDPKMAIMFPDSVLRKWALAMIFKVNRLNKKNTQKNFESYFKKKEEVPDFEPLLSDKKLSPFFENIVDENVGLIKSLARYRLPSIKNSLVALVSKDAPQAQIAEMLQNKFNATKSQAALIARDQVGKLNGQLNEYRQKQLGAKRYIWRTVKDERVRKLYKGRPGPDHKHLEGKICYWNKPPIVNTKTGKREHPGQDFQCRCWAEMIPDDILD
jgi:SPP1 gp7 family putative phage head morphogenesis protein